MFWQKKRPSLLLYRPDPEPPHAHRRVDAYSFGIVMSEVYSKDLPFSDVPRNEKVGFNNKLTKDVVAGRKRVKNDAAWGAEINDLIDRSTRLSPTERPRFGEIAAVLKRLLDGSKDANDSASEEDRVEVPKEQEGGCKDGSEASKHQNGEVGARFEDPKE